MWSELTHERSSKSKMENKSPVRLSTMNDQSSKRKTDSVQSPELVKFN